MLTGGTRAVLRRHQTLRAALEWSHGLLSEPEQVVFRRLGVFAGGFTLESAQRVAEDEAVDMWDVLEHLGTLVDKSLVLAEGESVPRYRMLETTRLFALEQLGAAGETEAMLRGHAMATTTLLDGWVSEHFRRGLTKEEDALLAAESENVRAAYDWLAGTGSADDALAVELGSVGVYSLGEAGGVSDAFDRTAVLASRIGPDTRSTRVALWLGLATHGCIIGTREAYEAAGEAIELFRRGGDDGQSPSARALPYLPHRHRRGAARLGNGWPRWSTRRSASSAPSGTEPAHRVPLGVLSLAAGGGTPARGPRLRPRSGCAARPRRLAAQRPDDDGRNTSSPTASLVPAGPMRPSAHCRQALEQLRGYAWGTSHVEETPRLRARRRAKTRRRSIMAGNVGGLSRSRLALPVRSRRCALCAARQGRWHDAVWVVGYVDRLYALRGEVRWPFAQRRRAELAMRCSPARSTPQTASAGKPRAAKVTSTRRSSAHSVPDR